MTERPVEQWREKVDAVLESKRNEFELLGYQDISTDDIWRCIVDNIWKGKEFIRLYEVVQSIFHLKIHKYMDYIALDSLQQMTETEEELMASIHAVMGYNDEANDQK